ncbi:hypothetical protein ACLOJK_024643 [Asimina triloba]
MVMFLGGDFKFSSSSSSPLQKLGELRVCSGSFEWRKYGENASMIAVDLSEVTDITWTKDRWCQLCLRLGDGSIHKFLGFLEQDAGCLNNLFPDTVKIMLREDQMSVRGKNCIELGLNEQSCEISLPDSADVYLRRKNNARLRTLEDSALMYEIVDRERVMDEEDLLLTMTFHMPHCDGRFLAYPSSQCFHDKCLELVDGSTYRRDAIAMFRLVMVGAGAVNSGGFDQWAPGVACVVLEADKSFESVETIPTYISLGLVGKDVVKLRLQITEEDRVAEYGGQLKASYETIAGDLVYPEKVFSKFRVPGDNIVIADGMVARVCKLGLKELAVNIQIAFWVDHEFRIWGPMHEIFIDILAVLADKKVSRPGCFNNSVGGYEIFATIFSGRTPLYPMEKFFAIESVNFRLHGVNDFLRSDNSEAFGDGNRFFEMSIQMKAGKKYKFEMIRVEEYQNLSKHLKRWARKALSGLFNAERSTCTIDPHNFCKRLEGLYYYWKGCKNGVWSHFDVLTVAVPRVPDTKSSTFSIWLLGHEARGMIMLFSEKNIQFLCSEDQANVLETVKDSVRKVVNAEMTIHVKKENSGGVELMDDVLDAIRIQPTHESLVAGYNTAEVPEVGYFCTWTEKLKKKFEICDITDGLSEVFSVKDDIALANMKAASSLASSVMRDFVVPEIVHMFGDEVAPHSELINDMVVFIHDEAEAVGLNKENVRIHGGRPVFQSGCGFGLDDLSLPMDNWDLECLKTGVIISSVGLRCNGYWSNMSRTILIYPCIKQVLALRALIKAQKAAISVLRPGNKVSAAYQEAVSVVEKEAPEFAPHLTESAGSGIGLEFCDSRRLSLDGSNERVLEVGMVFNVSLGFENLQVDTGNPLTEKFSMLIADTVVINEASTEALTDFSPCLIGTDDDECLKVINISDYEAEYPKGQRHYVLSEDVWDDAVDSNNNCDNVVRLIQVDEKMEAVFLPFFGSMVPFHISCIRRVVGSRGERDDQYYLYVFFNTDDDKKMQLGPEAPSYLQDLSFYFMSPRGVREIGRGIKALQLKYALREARTRRAKQEVAGNAMLAQQDSENVRGENHPCKKRRLSLSRNNPSA